MKQEFSYFRKGEQTFPVIDVELKGPKNNLTLKALVDSGASFSVFRSEVAEYLGIEIEKGKQIYLEGIGGRILGYFHKLSLRIGSKTFLCKIIFSPEMTVSFNLLGRNNFFVPFTISFQEKSKMIIIQD
ncbi:MAG: retropepsin-like domain-containing protein [Candidatus Omnitrophica bacterium]|nr:retropepsin-like domain-containing protein [Candidatus Omnitrophota bacterium]